MTVASILAHKGSDTVTVSPDDSLKAVAGVLDRHKIGAVIALDGTGKLAGIMSERDIVRAIARGGTAVLDDPVSSHMTKKVVTCTSKDRISSIMRKMSEGKFRHVPVVDSGKLVGVISIGDVVKRRIADIEMEWQAMQDYIAAS
ncbi:MAG: CBS domain-containing protein [Rhodobiaceae bacterium]|nr:CBS domain-containing protein [Rhodobiaceae bacterium]MCC0016965.1 CBS domain-containing protein [Rhodobiaceae bacterium]MCC0042341.1 CBS domain-containing protein [Rhodobiaceae bacterium]MCC0054131.1 CBS domain-containing protein [Rhodobiaceae bacterium]